MIIACPACRTRYAVPDTAIGSDGRTVRCAKCKHSWYQDPPVLDLVNQAGPAAPAPQTTPIPPPSTPPSPGATRPGAQPAPPQTAPVPASDGPSISHWRTPGSGAPASDPDDDTSLAARALRRGLSQNQPGEEPAPVTPHIDPPAGLAEPDAPPVGDAEPFDDEDDAGENSRFDYRAPFNQRRNTLKMWTFAAVIFAVLATGMVAAVNTYGLPDWVPVSRPTFGVGQPGLELDFPTPEQRKETLANGEAIFRVRGTITNTARETLGVPNLLVVFSDARERKVGDWVVVPAQRQLAPGETVTVTEAIANIPPGAAVADLGWAPN